MPTYVYECKKCEEVFEVEQRITEDALKDCECGAKGGLRRLIQPVGVVFNGAGFHINDYQKTPPKSEAASKPKSAEKATPDSKPAETAATPDPPATNPAKKD